MDRHANNARNVKLATVVRQFRPSRIERQLLAQVFEFVVATRSDGQQAAFDSMNQRHTADAPLAADKRGPHAVKRSAA